MKTIISLVFPRRLVNILFPRQVWRDSADSGSSRKQLLLQILPDGMTEHHGFWRGVLALFCKLLKSDKKNQIRI